MEIERIRPLVKRGWIIACLGTFGIFLLLSFFNCPASDDYTYARWMREWGFADAQITIFFAWGGRYFSNILLTLFNSLSYSADYKEFLLPYQMHSVVHILLFVGSTLVLFQRIRFIPYTWLALIPIAVFVQKANIIAEFFYWMAGTVTYCSGYIFGATALASCLDVVRWRKEESHPIKKREVLYFALILVVVAGASLVFNVHKSLIHFFNLHPLVFLVLFSGCILFTIIHLWTTGKSNSNSNAKRWKTGLVLVFSLAGCAGSSELTGAILIVTLGFIWIGFANVNRLKSVSYHLPIFLAICALALNVLAPATANRQSTVDGNLLHHWDQAFRTGFFILSQSLHLIPLFFTGIFLSILFPRRVDIENPNFNLLWVGVLSGAYFLTIGFFLPVLTAYQSGELPLRAVNAHVLTMAVSVFLYGYYFGSFWEKRSSSSVASWAGLASLFLLVWFVFDPTRNGIHAGLQDLLSGEAKSFKEQFIRQQKEILECLSDTCQVTPIVAKPISLPFAPNPVLPDREFGSLAEYKTYSYALFYGKKFIYQQ